MRNSFRGPNEVRGHVTLRDGSVLTAVDWPRAPQVTDTGSPNLKRFLTPSRANVQEAAAYVACSVSWARAIALQKAPRPALSRDQFCDFASALGDLYALGSKASRPGGISDEETASVRIRAGQLRNHYGAERVYGELYRLRADLLDLLPEKARTQSELVEAQEDRVRYAMLSPGLRELSGEEKRMAALALARPALLVDPKKPIAAPRNWEK